MRNEISKTAYQEATRIAKEYYDLIELRRQIEKEILYGSAAPADGMPGCRWPGNPTASLAERMIREKEDVERKLNALQIAFDALPTEWDRKLIRENLYRQPPIAMECLIARGIPYSVRTMKRIRRDYIIAVAELLKLV